MPEEEMAVQLDLVIKTRVTRVIKVPKSPTAEQLKAALSLLEEEVGAEIDDRMLDIVDVDNCEDFYKEMKLRHATN